MSLFMPTVAAKRIVEITPQLLEKLGTKALLLDIDNTMASYVSHLPLEGVKGWVEEMKAAGFELIIISNNYPDRVEKFAELFPLPYIPRAYKPLPLGYNRACEFLGVKKAECVIIGDQVFTDIIGANLCGMKSILLEPIELETGPWFKVRRFFERPVRKKLKKRGAI